MRGCGMTRSGSSITMSPQSRMSRSTAPRPHPSFPCRGPAQARSLSRGMASSISRERALSCSLPTAFRNRGWSVTYMGSVSYRLESTVRPVSLHGAFVHHLPRSAKIALPVPDVGSQSDVDKAASRRQRPAVLRKALCQGPPSHPRAVGCGLLGDTSAS